MSLLNKLAYNPRPEDLVGVPANLNPVDRLPQPNKSSHCSFSTKAYHTIAATGSANDRAKKIHLRSPSDTAAAAVAKGPSGMSTR